ncbi:hypothetical protein [Nonomuraea cavernae]
MRDTKIDDFLIPLADRVPAPDTTATPPATNGRIGVRKAGKLGA